ncbi:MAG TPA: TIGR03086 family metal-binding protein [Acidimicrobiia bacterium]
MIDDLDEAAEAMRRVIAGSSSGDGWNLPSPCAGWTVRDVINHVVTGNLRTLAWTNTDNGPPNEDDYLGADPLGAFNASFREVRARLAELLARDAAVQTPFAVLTAERLIEMRCCELAVHAWDVARETSQSTDFAPEVCERVLVIARARMQGLDRAQGPFGAEQPSGPGASAADRLAAFLGRASGA